MSSPESAPEKPLLRKLAYFAIFLIVYVYGMVRSDRPWEFWVWAALAALNVWIVAGMARDRMRYRAWVRSSDVDRLAR